MELNKTTWIIIGLVVLILAVLILGKYLGWFQRKLKLVDGEGEVDKYPNGEIDESRYASIAKTVKDNLDGANYQSQYFEDVADMLIALNLNEMRVTHNVFSRDYATNEHPTIRSRVTGEYVGASWWLGGMIPTPCTEAERQETGSLCYKQKLVLDKLNKINA